MTADALVDVVDRFGAQIDALGKMDCPNILRRSVLEMAQKLAREVFATACAIVAAAPKESLPKLTAELEAQAAVSGCHLATALRRGAYPNMTANEPTTEIELFAAQRYWASLVNLIEAAGAGGRA